MNVYLTFDVEIWCDGWDRLNENFPSSYERYVYGRSEKGEWALPKTLEILNRNGLNGVFFVEPLFSARFGSQYLEQIVHMIRDAGQDVQLHLHPEWTDEIRPALIEKCEHKRQHLSYYTLEEQTALISHGRRLLETAGSGPISTFRADSFAANHDTYDALRANRIFIDSSPNRCYAISAPDLRQQYAFTSPIMINGVSVYPVALFTDGIGKQRPAQINGCSFEELREAMLSAEELGQTDFVIVSHNFELLKPDRSEPDYWVVRRFERLCELLRAESDHLTTKRFAPFESALETKGTSAHTSLWATGKRYAEQLLRRLP